MQFTAKTRSVQGSSASRRLRRAGRVPGIVYGGETPALSIDLDHNEIYHALRKEQFHSSILEMVLDGKPQRVLLRAVQWHPYKPLVLHVDFQRVKTGQAISTKVPFHFLNEDTSPAVKVQGAQINIVMNEVEINCLPRNLPSFIEVDLGEMNTGDVVHLSDIKAPEGVEFAHHGEEDPVIAVAAVIEAEPVEASAEEVAEEAVEAEAPAEE